MFEVVIGIKKNETKLKRDRYWPTFLKTKIYFQNIKNIFTSSVWCILWRRRLCDVFSRRFFLSKFMRDFNSIDHFCSISSFLSRFRFLLILFISCFTIADGIETGKNISTGNWMKSQKERVIICEKERQRKRVLGERESYHKWEKEREWERQCERQI